MLITRRADFSASHSCYNPNLSEEENYALYGERPDSFGHGHNYVVEVTLEGTPDPVTGMIFDLKELKEILNEEVIEPMDHRHLNREVPPFHKVIPTPENIVAEIWRRLEPRLQFPTGKLHSVRLYETEDCYVEYAS
ncbi:MAG TPA: 6-carboxytetrahydropterin synthase [Bryobacteraceae bacterium]|nr:6-carboxytetrahydropterin synthase [Bryobacteraceae bacterium]